MSNADNSKLEELKSRVRSIRECMDSMDTWLSWFSDNMTDEQFIELYEELNEPWRKSVFTVSDIIGIAIELGEKGIKPKSVSE
jgi:hypothetical protein